MPLKAPYWWYQDKSLLSALLAPAAYCFSQAGLLRWRKAKPYRSSLPIICVGNSTAGGAGKTPTAQMLAEKIKASGHTPAFLSRGYGGQARAALQVNPAQHNAKLCGDEALLLAQHALTIISKDRVAGARLIENLGADIIIMDDGFQNPSIEKDFSLLVLDREIAIGNGKVIPAGPLRMPLWFQLPKADALLILGDTKRTENRSNTPNFYALFAKQYAKIAPHLPLLTAKLTPKLNEDISFQNTPFIAYSGIGRPEKFFTSLESLGAQLIARHSFGDHYMFKQTDAAKLLEEARQNKARLITTEKDMMRLKGQSEALKKLYEESAVLPIQTSLDEQSDVLLQEMLKKLLK